MSKQLTDIVIHISCKGEVSIDNWEEFDMTTTELVQKLRDLAKTIEDGGT